MQQKAIPGTYKSPLLFLLLMLVSWLPAQAQVDVEEFIRSGTDNTQKLLRAYGTPLTKGFETGLNAGWLTNGETFEPWRFEVQVSGSAAFVPQKDQTFDVTRIGLNANVQPANPANTIAPTFFGEDRQGLPLEVYGTRPDNGERIPVADFNSAPGIGFQIAPLPMIQGNIGLPGKTELMVRFFPEIQFSDNRVKLWGLGFKHQIGQWIPGLNQLPFALTASLAYTAFAFSDGQKLEPEKGVANPNPGNYSTQRILFDTQAYHASLIASKVLFKSLSAYGGLSYSKGRTEAALAGTYPVTVIRQQAPYTKEVANLTDPVKLDFDHGQLGLTGGLRLKMGIVSLNLAGTWSQYSSVSAGLGLGWN